MLNDTFKPVNADIVQTRTNYFATKMQLHYSHCSTYFHVCRTQTNIEFKDFNNG